MTAPQTVEPTEQRLIAILGQRIRVDVRWGTGVPLALCNGIGAGLEVLDPLVAHLDQSTTVVRFDVPGSGGSATESLPHPSDRTCPHQPASGNV